MMLKKLSFNIKYTITILFVFFAMLVVSDFCWPTKILLEKVVSINKKKERYYNAAKNHHFSYKIITDKHCFSVDEKFAKHNFNLKFIRYKVSYLFQQVNGYKALDKEHWHVYSLRVFSGLIFPLIAMLILVWSLIYQNKDISVMVFTIQISLLGDLIFLLS